jgi:proteasome alpha subunit
MEAISTRHSYVREKLTKGQPVIAVPYNEGALILSFSPQPGKIFEVYDRIAMGGLGHPADIERLRMTLLEMAHLEGFNRSAQDVTLGRLLQFGIAPALKQNFEEVQRAPYLIQLLLVEIDVDGTPLFFRVNYDGYWEKFKKGTVISGDSTITDWIEKKIADAPFHTYSLEQALKEALNLWQEGTKHAHSEEEEDNKDDNFPKTLKEAFEQWSLEAAVLCNTSARKSLYRVLSETEIDAVKNEVSK